LIFFLARKAVDVRWEVVTDEFVSNPPFSKNEFGGSNIATQFLARTITVV
jgi:hypothetical protein